MKPQVEFKANSKRSFVLILFFLGAALLIPDPAWNIMLIMLGGVVILSFVWVRVLERSIQAQRYLRANWVAVGDVLVEQFEIENRSFFPALWIQIAVESNVVGYRPAFVVNVGGRTKERWRQASVCTKRGRYEMGAWTLRLGDPFGLFECLFHYDEFKEIIIHPPILPTVPVQLPSGNRDGRFRRKQISWQNRINASSVRDYDPNDPMNIIHWRSSAKTGSLHVRHFDPEAGGDVWLLLDLDQSMQLGQDRLSIEEQAVLLAASLAVKALQERRGVGLAAYGRMPQLVFPGRGESQRWRLLEALAMVSAEQTVSLKTVLADFQTVVQQGTAVLLVTANPSPDWLPLLNQLSRLGVTTSVALFDRLAFGGRENMSPLYNQIQQMGLECTLLQPGDIVQQTLEISPFTLELGRVV
ncbi:MAG: DUF58 domain-containing protein [Chloroflexota bacterium]